MFSGVDIRFYTGRPDYKADIDTSGLTNAECAELIEESEEYEVGWYTGLTVVRNSDWNHQILEMFIRHYLLVPAMLVDDDIGLLATFMEEEIRKSEGEYGDVYVGDNYKVYKKTIKEVSSLLGV